MLVTSLGDRLRRARVSASSPPAAAMFLCQSSMVCTDNSGTTTESSSRSRLILATARYCQLEFDHTSAQPFVLVKEYARIERPLILLVPHGRITL